MCKGFSEVVELVYTGLDDMCRQSVLVADLSTAILSHCLGCLWQRPEPATEELLFAAALH